MRIIFGIVAAFCLLAASPVLAGRVQCKGEMVGASWYGPGFDGRRTASGGIFHQGAMTAAHKTLPFGTRLRVTYRKRSVVVTINDRGPYVRGRSLDLSKGAASHIGLIGPGSGKVCMERL
jgi:rare lipoprotein A